MDQSFNEENQEQDWFDDFITNYDYEKPKTGQVLEGTVIRIEEDALLVDVSMKRDAIVPGQDLSQLDKDFLSKIEVGDLVKVQVTSPATGDRDLYVSLSKGLEHIHWEQAEKHLEDGSVLDLVVVGHNRGGLIIQFETLRGFLPFSQIPELRQSRDPRLIDRVKRDAIGTTMEMKVIEVVRHRNRLIFSAWAAKTEKRQQRLEELEKDQIIHGTVTSVVDFGIFVDLDSVDGLVHISQLDWRRVTHPSDLYKVGDEVDVQVMEIDVERERVSLSRKTLLPSPWQELAQNYQPGDCVVGRVTKLVDFGAFVELAPGVEGLIHTSQLGYSASQDTADVVKRGEQVLVRILNIDTERERVSLSMRQVPLENQIAWAVADLDAVEISDPDVAESVLVDEIAPESDLEEGEIEPQADVLAELQLEMELQTEDQIEPKLESEIESEDLPEPEPEVEPQADDQTEPEPESETELEPDVEGEPVAEIESESEIDPEAKMESEVEADPEAEIEIESAPAP